MLITKSISSWNNIYKTINSYIEQCSQMLCQFLNEEEVVDAIMCGKSGNYCSSDQWCTSPSNIKESYWTSDTYPKNSSCNSFGNLILYKLIFSDIWMIIFRWGQLNLSITLVYCIKLFHAAVMWHHLNVDSVQDQ